MGEPKEHLKRIAELKSPFRFIYCPSCDKKFSVKDFIRHVELIHACSSLIGNKEMTCHINRSPNHLHVYKWTLCDKPYYEYVG